MSAAATLAEALWEIPAVDHHAHGVVAFEPTLDEFRGMFSESPDPGPVAARRHRAHLPAGDG